MQEGSYVILLTSHLRHSPAQYFHSLGLHERFYHVSNVFPRFLTILNTFSSTFFYIHDSHTHG